MQEDKIQFSDLIVGTMRLGSWGVNMTTHELERFVDECLDLGLNDFDHADIYGHYTEEDNFGKVLARRPDLKSKIQITTKCGIKLITENRPDHAIKSYDSTKKHIIWSTENSLKSLNVDVLDVMLIHRPDILLNPHEIAETFTRLKEQGKVKYFGVSNFTPSQFELLNSFFPLITNQVEISILQRNAFNDGTLDQCMRLDVTPTCWSPLGGGNMFGVPSDDVVMRIQSICKELEDKYNASLDQLILAFLFKHPSGIVPVLGTSKIERIKKAKLAKGIDLSHEDWYKIWTAAIGDEVA